MASSSHALARSGRRRALIALALSVTAAAAMAFANTGTLVERSFESALMQQRAPASLSERTANSGPQVAGTEDFWLSPAGLAINAAPREVSLAMWAAPVKLGTTLTLTVAGEPLVLEVIDITDLSPSVTRVDTSSAPANLVVVTLREAGKPEGPLLRLVTGAGHTPHPVTAQRSL